MIFSSARQMWFVVGMSMSVGQLSQQSPYPQPKQRRVNNYVHNKTKRLPYNMQTKTGSRVGFFKITFKTL